MAEDADSPEAQGWQLCAEAKPTPWMSVHVVLPDNSVRVGFWNGSTWNAGGSEVDPVYWRPLTG
jgi:hypothetical protein